MVEMGFLARRYEGRKVLVTGGTGFIGSHVCRRLAAYGADVVALSRGGAPVHGVEHVRGDVRDESAVDAVLARGFDYVFHLAAYSGQVPSFTDHEQSLAMNCLATLNVLEAVRRHSPDASLCFASSRLVYGRTRYLPVDEDHPREALSLYGIHKRTCEDYLQYYGERWRARCVTLRLANPYGPHDPADHSRYNVANWMIDELSAGREVTIFGRGKQLRDYIYIDDAVDAMLLAAADPRAAGRTYNVGSATGTAIVDFVRLAVEIGGRGTYSFAEWPADMLQVETGDYTADIARIDAELGWHPRVALAEGMVRTLGVPAPATTESTNETRAAA